MWIWHVSTTTIMNYLPSNLEFKDGVAFIGETSLLDVAKEYGTPLYVYDWEHLRDNIAVSYTHLTLPTTIEV